MVAAIGGPLIALAFLRELRACAPPVLLRAEVRPFPGEPRAGLVLAGTGLAAAIVLLPLLLAKIPPFDDMPNHLARIHVLASQGGDALLDQFYAVRWRIIPNLGMDLLLPRLARVTDVYFAGKAFLVATMLLLIAGPQAIQAALYRRVALGPLVALLFVYNTTIKMGMMNYMFGVGLALFAIASWIALREARPVPRLAAAAASVIVLFFVHLVALGLYGVAIASYEFWRLYLQPASRRARLAGAAILVLPFGIAAFLLLLGPTDREAAIPSHWGGLHARLDGIRFLFQSYDYHADLIAMLAMLGGFAWALRRGRLHFHPFGWVFLAAGLAIYAVIPNRVMGSWGAADRWPIAVLLVATGILRWDLAQPRARRAFLLAIALIALLRTAVAEAAFWRFDQIRGDLESSLTLVAPGSRVLVADNVATASATDPLRGSIEELPLLAVIERSCLVSTLYAHPLQQVVTVRPPYHDIAGGYADQPIPLADLLNPPAQRYPLRDAPFWAPSGRIYWADWPRSYDYLYLIDGPDGVNPAPDRLQPLYRAQRFTLFRIKHP